MAPWQVFAKKSKARVSAVDFDGVCPGEGSHSDPASIPNFGTFASVGSTNSTQTNNFWESQETPKSKSSSRVSVSSVSSLFQRAAHALQRPSKEPAPERSRSARSASPCGGNRIKYSHELSPKMRRNAALRDWNRRATAGPRERLEARRERRRSSSSSLGHGLSVCPVEVSLAWAGTPAAQRELAEGAEEGEFSNPRTPMRVYAELCRKRYVRLQRSRSQEALSRARSRTPRSR